MKYYLKIVFLLTIVSFMAGCAAPMSQEKIATIKTIGVVNKFPEKPSFTIIGTTVFNNEYDEVPFNYYNDVTEAVTSYLKEKGFQTSVLAEEDETSRTNVDLVIEIIPRDIYGVPGTFGYGVYQRSFLGISSKPFVYVALNLGPYLRGSSQGNAFFNHGIAELEMEALPPKWSDLTPEQQSEIDEKFKKQIDKTVSDLIVQLGI